MIVKLNIDHYRKKLATIDSEMISLLGKRNKISAAIGKLKYIENIAIKQPEIWNTFTKARNKKVKKMKLNKKTTTALFQTIHKDSVQIQKKVFKKLKANEK